MALAYDEPPLFTVRVIDSSGGTRKRRIPRILPGRSKLSAHGEAREWGMAQMDRCMVPPRAGRSSRGRRTPTTSDRHTCALPR